MANKKIFIIPLLSLLSGILVGFLLLFLFIKLPLTVDSHLYKILGLKKPHIIGFQPFWLLQKAERDYIPYLTTFTYFGLTIDSDGGIVKLANSKEEDPGWTTLKSERFNNRLKQAKQGQLKLSLLLHQSDEASIAALLEKPEVHGQNLIKDITPIMKDYGFTDLNLDIESFKEASESTQLRFTTFVKEVKKGIDRQNLGTLTVEITPLSLVRNRLVNPYQVGKIADYIVLMAYDFHYLNSFLAGPVAPLGGAGVVREFDVETALAEALNFIPNKKIILGIPLYGYEWETLGSNPSAATIPAGGSVASHRRVEQLLASCTTCTMGFGRDSKQPYLIVTETGKGYYQQIFYEDEQSLKEKLALAKERNIAGVALWALGYEGEGILESLRKYKQSVKWI